IAITVLIAGVAIGDTDPAAMARKINEAIGFIAPQVRQFDSAKPIGTTRPEIHAAGTVAPVADPELVQFISVFITRSRSGAAGAIGLSILLLIVIQLFSSVENTFNDIWGVRRGRSWMSRIIHYWAAVTLGAVLFFASFTLLSAGPII
ncbi:YhjD/YihY/BrkB family envelope integrity protein, partial [Ralstonia solanacearum species complex bacterium KE711]|uniref:YhjD/YihY/BrkB family envelope integrity protein n=1 Tax=Ralstonia solanacearum species complex bacterium KE711 TaxID=3119583 RepID=UPI002FC2880C